MPYDLQAESYDYATAIEWRMNIQTKQNKPHKKRTCIAQELQYIHNNNIRCTIDYK